MVHSIIRLRFISLMFEVEFITSPVKSKLCKLYVSRLASFVKVTLNDDVASKDGMVGLE